MTVYGTRGLVQKRQAYQLLAKAAEEAWGISPLPGIEREAGGKPFSPARKTGPSTSATAGRWRCARWTALRLEWMFRW